MLGIVICPFDVTLLTPDDDSAGAWGFLGISYLVPYHVRTGDLHFNPSLRMRLRRLRHSRNRSRQRPEDDHRQD